MSYLIPIIVGINISFLILLINVNFLSVIIKFQTFNSKDDNKVLPLVIPSVILIISLYSYICWFITRYLGSVGQVLILIFTLIALFYNIFISQKIFDTWIDKKITFLVMILQSILVCIIFLWHTQNTYFEAVQIRTQLPVDNVLPSEVGKMILEKQDSSFLFGDWKTSDRPPLATGLIFALKPYFLDMNYHQRDFFILVGANSLFLLSIIAVISNLDILNYSKKISIILVSLTSLPIIINYSFTWPKLLSASCTLSAISLIIYAGKGRTNNKILIIRNRGRNIYSFALILEILSVLYHGAEVFVVAPLIFLTGILHFKSTGITKSLKMYFAIVCVYIPWYLHQKFIVPSNDRLLKYHLAWHHDISSDSFFTTFKQTFVRTGIEKWSSFRIENIKQIFGGTTNDFFSGLTFPFTKSIAEIKYNSSILHTFYSLTPLVLLIILEKSFFNNKQLFMKERVYKQLLTCVISGYFIWIFAIFEPGGTIMTVGPLSSYIFLRIILLVYIIYSGHRMTKIALLIITISDLATLFYPRITDLQSSFSFSSFGTLVFLIIILISYLRKAKINL